MRRTKIVCTIGPATESEEHLKQLMLAGMNVARLNFSHGTHEEHGVIIERIRTLSEQLNTPVAILQDLQGPKIRVGDLRQPVTLIDGTIVTITAREVVGTALLIPTTYKALPQDVKVGDSILLDDGLLELRVTSFTETDVQCLVIHGGLLKSHKGINLPGVVVSSPSLTEKDREDLRFGILHNVDYVALSFIRTAQDVIDAREYLKTLQAESDDQPSVPFIAKIEKPEAVTNLSEILAVVDGIMVARGDLGVEMPLEKVPFIQKHIIAECNALGIPVITATQMLESMVTNPRPTRAEVNDVANAVIDQTDAIMLSAETSVGLYPIETVQTMVRIALEIESGNRTFHQPQRGQLSKSQAVSHAARELAEEVSVKAIVVFTRSGLSAHLISKDRPRTPILAYTPSSTVYRQLALWWGVWPYCIEMQGTTGSLITLVDQQLQKDNLIQNGEYVVIMGGLPIASQARTNFVKLHRVGDD